MRKFALCLVMLLMAASPASAYDFWKGEFDPWTKRDTKLQIASTVLIWFDLYQTDVAIKNNGYEWGLPAKFYGPFPKTEQLIEWGVICTVGNYLIARILPHKLRSLFQAGTIVNECYYISVSYGTKLVFNF